MLEGRFHYAQELESTNDLAMELVRSGAGSGTLVLAERQTRGRGRRGAAWACPSGEGLLFSFVLEPDIERAYWSRLALAAGVAVVDAFKNVGGDAQVKWPNDVWIKGRKCAGVLIESCEDYVIIGIGINVAVRAFPEGLAATSLLLEGKEVVREDLLADVLRGLISWGSRCGAGYAEVVDAVNAHCALRGSMIQLKQNGELLYGKMAGVDAHGHLLLDQAGTLQAIAQADEVRMLA